MRGTAEARQMGWAGQGDPLRPPRMAPSLSYRNRQCRTHHDRFAAPSPSLPQPQHRLRPPPHPQIPTRLPLLCSRRSRRPRSAITKMVRSLVAIGAAALLVSAVAVEAAPTAAAAPRNTNTPSVDATLRVELWRRRWGVRDAGSMGGGRVSHGSSRRGRGGEGWGLAVEQAGGESVWPTVAGGWAARRGGCFPAAPRRG